jgi:hypothetical protein
MSGSWPMQKTAAPQMPVSGSQANSKPVMDDGLCIHSFYKQVANLEEHK